jgi:hypothetical protein
MRPGLRQGALLVDVQKDVERVVVRGHAAQIGARHLLAGQLARVQ